MFSALKTIVSLALGTGLVLLSPLQAQADVQTGDALPAFQLKSNDGKLFTNQNFASQELGVLFLFKTQKCKSCVEGLRKLQTVSKEIKDDKVLFTSVDVGSDPQIAMFADSLGIQFPVLAGDEAMLQSMSGAGVLPVTIFTGPNGKVIKVVQGGGGQIPKIVTTLAEQQLQRKKLDSAQSLYSGVQEPEEGEAAQAGMAYSLLKAGKQDEAQKIFQQMSASPDPKVALTGKEGLAEILFQQGKTQDALAMAQQVATADPNRSAARLVAGKSLFAQGKKQEAEKEIAAAADAKTSSTFSWQKADAHMAFGNLKDQGQQTNIALKSFQEASKVNPYYVEALSNQGVALQKLGEPEKALEVFKNVKSVDPADKLVHSLLRQSEEAIKQKKDLERQNYIDGMVKDLVTRFKSQKGAPKPTDDWTSPVGAISILGFENTASNALLGRTGMEGVLKDELTRELGVLNVSVVERAILDKVMAELNLGSSELANPKTALELGKLTAAHVIATGSFYDTEQGNMATLRLVETETTDIFLALTEQGKGQLSPTELAKKFAQQIAGKVREKFPLKGRILKVKDDEVIINIGERQAVTKDTVFNVLTDGTPLDLGNGEVEYDFEQVGKVQVTRTTEKVAYAKILDKKGDWKDGQKIIIAQK